MSVRVNLLPAATKARGRATQARNSVVAAFAGLLLLLAGVWWWGTTQISAAEDDLEVARAQTVALQSEQNELAAFRDLADRRDASTSMLQSALGGEVSFAGVLQDIAAVMPSDTQLESFTIQLAQPGADPSPTGAVGTLNVTGKTLTSHAPGVERVLIQLDKVITFRDLYLNSSSLDDTEGRVASFSLDGQVDGTAGTGRYADGLPEVLR